MSTYTAQGKPDALVCRWCRSPRFRLLGALLCRGCDGPAHLMRGQR